MQLCFGQTVVRTGAGHPADEKDVAIMAFDILGCYRYLKLEFTKTLVQISFQRITPPGDHGIRHPRLLLLSLLLLLLLLMLFPFMF